MAYGQNRATGKSLVREPCSIEHNHDPLALTRGTDILQKRPKSATLKHHVITYLRDITKSFDYTLAVMQKLEDQARVEIAKLGGNEMLETIIDKLHVDHPGDWEE